MFRGDLSRNGHPTGAILSARQAAGLKLLWRQSAGGAIDGTPIVVGQTMVAATESGKVLAFDLRTGTPSWSLDGLGQITGTPAESGGIVVVGTTKGHVYGVSLAAGRKLWDWAAPVVQQAVWSSPAITGTRVLVGLASPYGDSPLEPGAVAAIDLHTGKQLWTFCVQDGCAPGAGVWSSVAVDSAGKGFVGVGNPVDGVMSFDVATGRKLWTTSFHPDADRDLDVGATPILGVVGGREVVAVGSNAGVFDVLDAATGAIDWSRFLVPGSAVHGLIASPAFDGSLIYVASASPPTSVTALEPSDGQIMWQQLTNLPVYSAAAVGVDVLIFGTGDEFGDPHAGELIALSTRNGSIVWRFDMKSSVFSSPAIVGAVVVVGDTQGDLVAFGAA